MTYDESIEILRQFESQYPALFSNRHVHGVRVMEGETPTLEVLLIPGANNSVLASDELLPNTFEYQYENRASSITVIILPSDIHYAHKARTDEVTNVDVPSHLNPTHSGDPAKGVGLPGHGTAGWTIYLDEVLVCLSNWHIFCVNGNSTQYGHPVEINSQRVAHLHFFYPILSNSKDNLWDLALAAYDDLAAASDQMRSCEDGFVYAFPRRLSGTVHIGGDETYHKVGATSPICRKGRLLGVGTLLIEYPQFGKLWFKEQLIFEKMSDRGDSGALIVRNSDNTVSGLNFAGNSSQTFANPIFRLGWTYSGSKYRNNFEVPMFSTNADSLISPASVKTTEAMSRESRTTPFDIPNLQSPPLPPIFEVDRILLLGAPFFPSAGQGQRVKIIQLRGEWGLFRTLQDNNQITGYPDIWIYIPGITYWRTT